jgi:hypothetical protein
VIKVESSALEGDTQLSLLQQFVNNHSHEISPPMTIPSSLLAPGQSYNFIVMLCNFLSQCNQANQRVSVVFSVIPTVVIPGSTMRSSGIYSVTSFSANASVSSCPGDDQVPNSKIISFSYLWSVYKGTTVLSNIISTSKDPSKFVIPAYSFPEVNSFYEIRVTASYNGQSSTYSTQLFVTSGNLIPVLNGASSGLLVREGSPLTVDGSRSYDQNQPSNLFVGLSAGLSYNWTCIQVKPVFLDHCWNVFDEYSFLQQLGTDKLRLVPLTSSANGEVQMTMLIVDKKADSNRRSAEAFVAVKILPALAATISLSSPSSIKISNGGSTNIINPSQSLQINGFISLPPSPSTAFSLLANVSWSVDSSSGLNLKEAALTSLTSSISNSSMIYLKLSSLTANLQGGLSYTFFLTAALSSSSEEGILSTTISSSSIIIQVNNPPLPGNFFLSPSEGIELSDYFTFACNSWQDDHLPLQYSFGYVAASGNLITLTSLSETSFLSLQLPAGLKANNYKVPCIASVYDNYLANTSVSVTAVIKEQVFSSSQLTAFLDATVSSSSLFSSNNVNSIKQATNLASYLLNKVNCSLAPSNCSSLNRSPCYRTPHTCGPCLSSSYIGTLGDSNEMCYRSVEEIPSSSSSSLTLKECPGGNGESECSGHGSCRYQSVITKTFLPSDFSCYSNNFTCIAVCQCAVGYESSPLCDQSEEEAVAKSVYRDNILQGINSLMTFQDVSSQTISDWVTNLNEATQVVGELSSNGIELAMKLANDILSMGSSIGIEESGSLSGLLDILDSSSSAIAKAKEVRRRRNRRFLSEELSSSSSLQLQSSLKTYSALVASSMVPGETAQTSIKNNIRVSIQSISLLPAVLSSFVAPLASSASDSKEEPCSQKTQISLPQTSLEKSLDIKQSYLFLPTCHVNNGGSSSSDNNLHVSISSISNSVYNNAYDSSDSVSLYLSSFPCSSSGCQIQIIMKRDPSSYNSSLFNHGRVSYNTSCYLNDYSLHNYSCPISFSYSSSSPVPTYSNFTVTCQGKEEIISSKCPLVKEEPNCNIVNKAGNVMKDSCQMVSFTDDNVTCLCRLLPSSSDVINDGPLKDTIPKGEISVNYVSMLSAVAGNFESTILSADDLSASTILKGKIAMIIVGTLFGSVVFIMLLAHFADKADQRREEGEKAKKDRELQLKSSSLANALTDEMMNVANKASNFARSFSNKNMLRKPDRSAGEGKGNGTNNILALAEESLPAILTSSKSFSKKVTNELKRHHRWFGVIYHYSAKLPRLLRVLSLATNIIIMLFVQSLTYDLTNGNDGSCERLTSEDSCLEPKSAFATGSSKCFWTPSSSVTTSSVDGSCQFIQPDNSMEVVLFVAIFSALISTPIALLADWFIINVLAAPTINSSSSSLALNRKTKSLKILDSSQLENAVSIVPRNEQKKRIKESKSKENEEKDRSKTSLQKFVYLTKELKEYRDTLIDPSEKAEFDCESCCDCTFPVF